MTRGTVTTQARPWPLPTGGNTLHCVGDVHSGVITQGKLDRSSNDMVNGRLLPSVVGHIQLGDQTNSALTAEDSTFQTWWAKITDAPKYLAMGNHDLFNSRTPTSWASTYGQPAQNYSVDLGDFRLIVVGPDFLPTDESNPTWNAVRIMLPDTTLTWLDTQLGATSKDCLIACHAPIKDTVLGDPALTYPSGVDPWFVTSGSHRTDSTGVLGVLAAHANAKAWISGHTHSPINTPQLVVGQTVGSHTMAMINCGALYFAGQDGGARNAWDPMHGLYVTHYGDRLDVRFRNHGAGVWVQGGGTTVKCATVTL